MSSVECLREFVNERLTAAAEEIFRVFKATIIEYEEEIDRQRKLLDVVWKPEIKLHRIELPQQHVYKEEQVLTEQQLWNQERNSSLDQEEPEPPQVKEEQEGEQLVLKQETDTFMSTPSYEESEHSDPEPNSDYQLLSNNSHVAESRDQKGGKHGESGSTRSAESKPQNNHHKSRHSNNEHTSTMSKIHSNTYTELPQQHVCKEEQVLTEQQLWNQERNSSLDQEEPEPPQIKEEQEERCTSQEEEQLVHTIYNSNLSETHRNTYTGKKTFKCATCGKDCKCKSKLIIHMRIHTGEKPYSCNTCGKRFNQTSGLKAHKRVHTGERPYSCNTCGKTFSQTSVLKAHMRIHTGEKPYSCETCGRAFRFSSDLTVHIRRAHTGEKPYNCNKCGKKFSGMFEFSRHIKVHIGK